MVSSMKLVLLILATSVTNAFIFNQIESGSVEAEKGESELDTDKHSEDFRLPSSEINNNFMDGDKMNLINPGSGSAETPAINHYTENIGNEDTHQYVNSLKDFSETPNYKDLLHSDLFYKGIDDDHSHYQVLPTNQLRNLKQKENRSFLSKVMSDPKTLTTIIPLAILLASVLPILMNYFLPEFAMPFNINSISTSRMVRSLTDKESLQSILDNLLEFGSRALSEDECFQKAICEEVLNRGGVNNTKNIISSISNLAFITRFDIEEWLEKIPSRDLVNSLKEGNCAGLCIDMPQQRRH